MDHHDEPEHVLENRRYWDNMADRWVASGEASWRQDQPTWGVWGVDNTTYPLLPDDMTGLDAIELGCGTGYVSAWMVRRGAHVVGIDNSERQLETARRLAAEHSIDLTLLHGNAESVPMPDGSFDFAISEYGAAIWCDPEAWLPEAYRLLRPEGRLVFLGNTPLANICTPMDGSKVIDRLVRSYFELKRLDWRNADEDPGGIEFNLPISGWFKLFRQVGFSVVDYMEIQAPADAHEEKFYVEPEWARRYPSEHVWVLRK